MLAVLAVAATLTQPAVLDGSCASKTQRAVERWIVAYNNGDARTLDRVFAPAGMFQWYSSPAPGRRLNAASKDRRTLRGYFAARHRAGDRLQLRRLQINATDRKRHLGHFEFTLRRRAPGYRGGRWFTISGKGAARCDRGQLIVVSLGSA